MITVCGEEPTNIVMVTSDEEDERNIDRKYNTLDKILTKREFDKDQKFTLPIYVPADIVNTAYSCESRGHRSCHALCTCNRRSGGE